MPKTATATAVPPTGRDLAPLPGRVAPEVSSQHPGGPGARHLIRVVDKDARLIDSARRSRHAACPRTGGRGVWVSPRHPDRERLMARQQGVADQAPPEPSGETLAAFPRRGRFGEDQELRVVLDQYEGHRYLAIRLWQRDGRSGAWWPLRGKESASASPRRKGSPRPCNRPSKPPSRGNRRVARRCGHEAESRFPVGASTPIHTNAENESGHAAQGVPA